MAKDRKKLIHIHSSIPDKQPTPQSLAVGEIAVNNAADQEFLSIKNSEDKVKRFSSDEQMITWMEKKEVMPYVGYVRGGAGPSATSAATPTADNYGSYGILESDLSGNTSEIVIKLNQVAASATTKHERVNGSKDRYDKDVNPTTDSGVNDGAGFFIDMSRYAMQGANPEFSGITNTCYTNLNGTTRIKGVDGACGSLLDITVNSAKTDIETANTEITSATTVIGTNTTTISGNTTLNVSGTTTETKKGNVTETNLADKQESTSGNSYNDVKLAYSGTTGGTTTEIKVGNVTESHSGTTTENKKGDVTENNLANKTENTTGNVVVNTNGTTTETKVGNVTENHSGTTTDNNKGNVVVNNQANFNMNTSGNTTFTTTGDTVIHSDGAVGITAVEDIVATSSESSIIVTANDDLCETAGDVAAFKGVNKTNVGIDCSDAGRTKVTNVYGDTINERANTADTRVTSAYTSATTATTIIGTANTSATTATLSGNTLVVNEATSISAKTPTAYISGTTLDVKETNTDITSCGRISANTNDFEVKQCATNGKAIINSDDIDISGKTFDVVETTSATIKAPATTISGTSLTLDEGTSISAKTPSTTISGTNFTLNETNTTINSCGKVEITTDSYSLKQCSTSGGSAEFEFCNGYTVKSNKISLQQCGSAGTISISAQTQNIYGGNLTINESGNTAINTTGTTNVKSTGNTNIETNGANNKVTIQASGTGGDVEVFAKDTLCMSGGSTAALVGTTKTNIGKNCSDAGQTTTLNLNGTTINETGATVNISGSTAANISGGSVSISGGSISEKSTGTTCIEAGTTAAIVGATKTNIGKNCSDGGQTTTLNINGTTINETGTTVNISGSTAANVSGATVVVSGNTTNISGATTLNLSGKTVNVDATDIDVDASNNYCLSAATKANIYGKATNIGIECGGTVATATTIEGTTLGLSGNTTNISGATTLSLSGKTVNVDATDIDVDASNNYCLSAATKANIYGKTTNIGVECGGTTATTINVSGTTINEGGTTNNNNFTTINNTATTINNKTTNFNVTGTTYISGDTTISGATIIGGVLTVPSGLSKKLTWTGGTFTADTTGYNGSADKVITVPTAISHLPTRGKLTVTHNGLSDTYDPASDKSMTLPHSALSIDYGVVVTGKTDDSYDTSAAKTVSIPTAVSHMTRGKLTVKHNGLEGEFDPATDKTLTLPHSALSIDYGANVTGRTDDSYDTSAAKTVYIPTSVKNLSNWNGTCYEFDAPLCVTGTITASGAIYSSDRNLKENIKTINSEDIDKVAAIDLKSFNFIDDESKTKVYGVIAQEVQEAGLDILVHQKEDGMLGVDYTSLLILKIAQLQKDNNNLVNFVASLDKRVKELEEKLNNKG